MTLNICCSRGEARIMSLIETIDLRYVKEEADFGTGSALECRFAFSLGEVLNKRWCGCDNAREARKTIC